MISNDILQFVNSNYDEDMSITSACRVLLISFIDVQFPCQSCKSSLEKINQHMSAYSLINNNIARWTIEADLSRASLADKLNIVTSPTHVFCRGNGDIFDIVTGEISDAYLTEIFS